MNASTEGSVSRNVSRAGSFLVPLLAGLALSFAAGCGNDEPITPSEETVGGFPKKLLPERLLPDLPLVPPKSARDLPLFTDIVDVPAGADITYCTYTNVILDEPTIFGESFGAQSPQGHHAIMYYTSTPKEPYTGECGEMMEDGQMLLGGTGGKAVADEPTLPVNFGVEVPAGAQLIINHHWINTTPTDVPGQSMMLARKLDRDGNTVMAGNMIMLGFGWELPPLSPYEFSTECKYDADVPYVLALGHMHEWGKNVRIDVTSADGSVENVINEEWTADSATGVGGGTVYSLDQPLTIKKGDTVKLTCQWQNTTAEPIGFPREMCIFFGYTVDTNFFCANGTWYTAESARGAGMGDIGSHL